MATSKKVLDFVRVIYPEALANYKSLDGVHPLFANAQAALETGWNANKPGNNLFGITVGSSWTGKKQLVQTTEYFLSATKQFVSPEKVLNVVRVGDRYKYTVIRYFRSYGSIGECLADHLAILKKPGYADAWAHKDDPREFARRIIDGTGAKYATDPDYLKKMLIVIGMVEQAVKELRL